MNDIDVHAKPSRPDLGIRWSRVENSHDFGNLVYERCSIVIDFTTEQIAQTSLLSGKNASPSLLPSHLVENVRSLETMIGWKS